MRELCRALRAVAAYGLPGGTLELPPGPPPVSDWPAFRRALRQERITGLAVAAADGGGLVLTHAQREQLEGDHVEAMAHVLRLERSLLGIQDVLTSHEIAFTVLKGSAVAHLDYAEPSLRVFGDNDLLVPGDQFPAAVEALLTAGWTRPAAEIRPGFDVRFGKGATLVGEGRHELDLHRTLVMGPFGLLIDLDQLWSEPSHFEVGGRELRALGTEQRYLHACYHSVVGNSERLLVIHRDLAEMLLFGSHDPGRLRELAESWGAGVVLARAICEAWDTLGLTEETPLLRWARSRRATRREQRMLRVYGPGTSYAAKSVASVTALPRWRDRLALVRMLALPAPGYTRTRGTTPLGWLVTGARRALRDWRRPSKRP